MFAAEDFLRRLDFGGCIGFEEVKGVWSFDCRIRLENQAQVEASLTRDAPCCTTTLVFAAQGGISGSNYSHMLSGVGTWGLEWFLSKQKEM